MGLIVLKNITIKETQRYSDNGITLSDIIEAKKCHIMTSSYGEVTSVTLNRTHIKKIWTWLYRWLRNTEPTKSRKYVIQDDKERKTK